VTSVVDINSLISTPEDDPWIKMLIYGPPGRGKTVFSARCPNPIILDTEDGTSSLRNFPDTEKTPVIKVRNLDRMQEVYRAIATDQIKCDTVVVDTFSELSNRSMDAWLTQLNSADPNRDKYLSTWPDFNRNQQVMRRLALALRDLPKHIILICHEREVEDKSEGRRYKMPDLAPELAKTMVSMMSVIGRMTHRRDDESGTVTRELQIEGSRTVEAKSRIIMGSPVIENPTFEMFLKGST